MKCRQLQRFRKRFCCASVGDVSGSPKDKAREIDILAEYSSLDMQVSFLVECKSGGNPWLVLKGHRKWDIRFRENLCRLGVMSAEAHSFMLERCPDFRSLRPFILNHPCGGYGFRQAHKDAHPAYTAAIAAIKASASIVNAADATHRFRFALPVVVVDAPLYECSLASGGDLELSEAQESEFVFSAYIPEKVRCNVRVVTKTNLERFVDWAHDLATAIQLELSHERGEEGVV